MSHNSTAVTPTPAQEPNSPLVAQNTIQAPSPTKVKQTENNPIHKQLQFNVNFLSKLPNPCSPILQTVISNEREIKMKEKLADVRLQSNFIQTSQ